MHSPESWDCKTGMCICVIWKFRCTHLNHGIAYIYVLQSHDSGECIGILHNNIMAHNTYNSYIYPLMGAKVLHVSVYTPFLMGGVITQKSGFQLHATFPCPPRDRILIMHSTEKHGIHKYNNSYTCLQLLIRINRESQTSDLAVHGRRILRKIEFYY